MTMQEEARRADAGSEPVAAKPTQSPDASARGTSSTLPDDVLSIVPVRNVVLFPGIVMPLVARPAEVDRRSAGGGAQPTPARRAAAARGRGRRSDARAAVRGRLPGRHSALRHRARRQPPHRLPGPAALSRARVRARASVPRRAHRADRGAGGGHARDRGAPVPSEGAGAGGLAAAAAGAAGAGQCGAGGEHRLARPPTWSRASWICGPRRSSRSSRRSTCALAWTRSGAARAPHRGAPDLARHRPADPGCGRGPPARVHPARAAEGDPEGARRDRGHRAPRSRSWRRRSPRPACPRRSSSRRGRS